MTKYAALRSYFDALDHAEFVLTFRQIEEVIGADVPAKAKKPQWWCPRTPPTAHDQRWAWHPSGYSAILLAGRKVRFVRSSSVDATVPSTPGPTWENPLSNTSPH